MSQNTGASDLSGTNVSGGAVIDLPIKPVDPAVAARNRTALIISSVFAGLSAVLIGFAFYYRKTRTLKADFETENFNYMFYGGLLVLAASIAVIVLSALQKL